MSVFTVTQSWQILAPFLRGISISLRKKISCDGRSFHLNLSLNQLTNAFGVLSFRSARSIRRSTDNQSALLDLITSYECTS